MGRQPLLSTSAFSCQLVAGVSRGTYDDVDKDGVCALAPGPTAVEEALITLMLPNGLQ